MSVTEVETEADFNAAVATGVVLVDFFAVWCGPCQVIAPKIVELAQEYKDRGVSFLKVDVDKAPKLARAYSVTAMPTFVLLQGGKVSQTIVGADLNRITNAIKTLAPPAAAASST